MLLEMLQPILTEFEMSEARRVIIGATTVDGHPWIWNDYKERGYVT